MSDAMTAAAARERLARIVAPYAFNDDWWTDEPGRKRRAQETAKANAYDRADAILSAFPEIGASAPGKDVVEGARRCHAEMAKCDSYDESLHVLAAFATAHAARVREAREAEILKFVDDVAASLQMHSDRAKARGDDGTMYRANTAWHNVTGIADWLRRTAIRAGGGR